MGGFAVPAFTPILLNVSLIGSAVFLAPQVAEPVYALALGVLFAGMIQLLFQLPALHGWGSSLDLDGIPTRWVFDAY